MRSGQPTEDVVSMWEIARPSRPLRLPGVDMAGFADRGRVPADLRTVPHPAFTLVVDFGASPLTVDDAGQPRRGSLVAGMVPGHVRILSERVSAVQVRLSPLVARTVLHAAPPDLDGALVTLDDVWGGDASRIAEQVHEARSWDERFALLDAMLVRRYDERMSVDPALAGAWQRVVSSRGQVRVDDLAADIGWSRKRLWSRFREQIGLTPKQAVRLVRFDHAVHRLAAGVRPAQVAAEGGYADQSHLHREITSFTGDTPTAMARSAFLAVDDTAWPDR